MFGYQKNTTFFPLSEECNYLKRVRAGIGNDLPEWDMYDDTLPVGLDVNKFIDKSRDFIAHSAGGSVWVIDIMSLKNMAKYFGYRIVEQAIGRSACGDISDIPCVPVERGQAIYLKSKPAKFKLKYETVVPGQEINFSMFGMEITEAYGLEWHSPVVMRPSDAFSNIDKIKNNKMIHVITEIGKISEEIDRLRISLEKTANHIYR
jgi:hypothetical protein